MSHSPHETAPTYSPAQVLVDDCGECALRSERPDYAISSMDPEAFGRAWSRADEFRRHGLDDPSYAEVPLLRILGAVQQQFENVHVPPAWLRERALAQGEPR